MDTPAKYKPRRYILYPGIVNQISITFDFANSTSCFGSGNDVYDLSDNYNHGVLNGNQIC